MARTPTLLMTMSTRPKRSRHEVAERFEVGLFGDVRRRVPIASPPAAIDHRRGLVGASGVEVAGGDAGAPGGERQGGGAADAAAGAGEDGDGAVEVEWASSCDRHRLRSDELEQSFEAAFAAEAGDADPAEGQLAADDRRGAVDVHAAGFEPRRPAG